MNTLRILRMIRRITTYGFLYLITFSIIASALILTPHDKNDFPVLRMIIVFFATILLTKYFIYMVLAPWHDLVAKRNEQRRAHTVNFKPKVSIVIPAWNESVGLFHTINTILASNYNNLEIIVVNDGSTDSSDAMMREFVQKYEARKGFETSGISIKYFYKQNGGKGRALNFGIAHATGEIIMSIDADCILTPTTIENFAKVFHDPQVMAAVGNVKVGNTNTVLGTIQYLEFLFSFYFKKTESLLGIVYIIGGAAGAFRREVFETIGLYNHENITEDIELSVRIQKAGMKIVYASDAIVYTEGASTLKGLMSQRLRWKRGRFQTFSEHKNMFFSLNKKHNKLLTFFTLPLAIFGEIQMFLELPFLIFLYIYSWLTNDYSSFVSGVIVVSSMFAVQIFFDDKSTKRASFLLLAPIGWLLFYVSTFVEYNALIKSIWHSIRKKELVWQKWDRKGCLDKTVSVV